MIQIHQFTFNPFQENTYVLYDETKECIIIDPGCYEKEEQKELEDFINFHELKPILLINTHAHIDHVLGNFFVTNNWNIGLVLNKLDLVTLNSVKEYCTAYGFEHYQISPEPIKFIDEGECITFGNSKLNVFFTPGHAPGHIVLYCESQRFLIAGDVLFQMSIGRTDLPGGDFDTLINSIKNKLMNLPDDTVVYPGHGPKTTIGFEQENNPFLKKL